MAAYNGADFIEAQLRSILTQLSPHDEIIIVDDASTDQTCSIIKNMGDARIKLITHPENMGSTQTFSAAIEASSGDIIFLSDQDDVWMADKISKVLAIIQKTAADLIIHDAQVMSCGEVLLPSLFKIRLFQVKPRNAPTTILVNWINTTFTGCCMAFTKELKSAVIPIPKGVWHDQWIGMMAAKKGFTIHYLPEVLVAMQRHGQNLTEIAPRYRQWWLMLYDRWKLMLRLLSA